MTPRSVRIRAGFLLYAAIQFVVLTAIAMRVYADDYRPLFHFFSELGASRAWSGRPNHAAMVLFSVAVVTLGFAFVAFAGAWRGHAFGRERARAAGIASQLLGTFSGAAFVAIGFTPVDVALDVHNTLVVVAYALLLGYTIAMTILWARNGASRALVAASAAYVLLVIAYILVSADAVRHGLATLRAREQLVVSQKLMVYASMLYVVYVTVTVRRRLRA